MKDEALEVGRISGKWGETQRLSGGQAGSPLRRSLLCRKAVYEIGFPSPRPPRGPGSCPLFSAPLLEFGPILSAPIPLPCHPGPLCTSPSPPLLSHPHAQKPAKNSCSLFAFSEETACTVCRKESTPLAVGGSVFPAVTSLLGEDYDRQVWPSEQEAVVRKTETRNPTEGVGRNRDAQDTRDGENPDVGGVLWIRLEEPSFEPTSFL